MTDAAAFSYHRSVAPMMWVLAVLILIETSVLHLMLAFWWPRVAIALSAISLLTLFWVVAMIRSFRDMPVLLNENSLLMRVGKLREVRVDRDDILRLRSDFAAREVKTKDVLNLALIAYPNVLIELRQPVRVGRRRAVRAIAHRLDNAPAFAAALSPTVVSG